MLISIVSYSFTYILVWLIILFLNCTYRPGRLEVHIEISLPDEVGRLQILLIHTKKMKDNSFLSPDVNLQELGMPFAFVLMLKYIYDT